MNPNSFSPVVRRDFFKLIGGAAVANVISTEIQAVGKESKLQPLSPGIKVSLQISTTATDEDLQFAQQIGVDYVNIPTGGAAATLENFVHLKQRVEEAGFK